MGRLTIFAKGNVDLRDSLLVSRNGDEVVWNGINEVLRQRHPGWLARIRHETLTRSDALLAATGEVPAELTALAPPLGAYSLASQFGCAVFDTPADVVALSIQAEVSQSMARHKRDGYLFFPNGFAGWPAEARAWLREGFEPTGLLTPEQSKANLAGVVERIRARSPAHIVIYNLSSAVDADLVHDYRGQAEDRATRIRRFNLALVELSRAIGVSVIDVDALVARAGASRLKLDDWHLTGAGCRLTAEEVVRVLDDLGLLAQVEGALSKSA